MLPGPTNVPHDVMQAMQQPLLNHRSDEFHRLYESVINSLKDLFNTESLVLPLTASGTGAIEAAVANLVPAKTLVLTNGEFGSRLADMHTRNGFDVTMLPVHALTAEDDVEQKLKEDPSITYVSMVYNDTASTVRNPLEEIADVCSEYDKLLIVDAVSSIGGDWLDVDKMNIDVCIGASQKCLACPPGLSFISVSERAWNHTEKRQTFYFDLLRMRTYYEERRETPFTPALSLYYALEKGLELVKQEGLEKRIRRHYECSQYLRRKLREIGMRLLIDDDNQASPTVTGAYLPEGVESKSFRSTVADHGVIIAGGIGATRTTIFRVGTMGIVTKGMVDETVKAIEAASA